MSLNIQNAALQLRHTLKNLKEPDFNRAQKRIESCINSLNLSSHILVRLVKNRIDMNGITKQGKEVIKELKSCIKFFECPNGTCFSGSDGFCIWCGNNIKHRELS